MSYSCPFCGKPCAKKFGLRNHLKSCKRKPSGVDVNAAYCTAVRLAEEGSGAEDNNSLADTYDAVERVFDEMDEEQEYRQSERGKGKRPFDLGAFLVMSDHIPLLLDIDFAIALGDHILEHGSDNKAVMAFGHQLKKLDES